MREKYGKFARVTVDSNQFLECIPDPAYRLQLVHGMCSGSLLHSVIIFSSTREIIRAVHVSLSEQQQRLYQEAMLEI